MALSAFYMPEDCLPEPRTVPGDDHKSLHNNKIQQSAIVDDWKCMANKFKCMYMYHCQMYDGEEKK